MDTLINEGNDAADQLAALGAQGYYSGHGRFEPDVPLPWQVSLKTFPKKWFSNLLLNKQNQLLAISLFQAAEQCFEASPPSMITRVTAKMWDQINMQPTTKLRKIKL